MIRKYQTIGPLITKIEGLVVNTSTGKSPRMALYYQHWEKKVYNSILKLAKRNLVRFNSRLNGSASMFQIEALLAPPDTVFNPSTNEIYKNVVQCVREAVESLRGFTRWMNGTCIETPPQKIVGEDEPFIFSFFHDISVSPEITELAQIIANNMKAISSNAQKYLRRWKRYQHVWHGEKQQKADRWLAKNPSQVDFDDRFQYYLKLIDELKAINPVRDEASIKINLAPMIDSIQQHCKMWIELHGSLLHDQAKAELDELEVYFNERSLDLARPTSTIEDLKFVLGVISNIKDNSLWVEGRLCTIKEKYRMLTIYNRKVDEEEKNKVAAIEQRWQDLILGYKNTDAKLLGAKKKFTIITSGTVDEYASKLGVFKTRFDAEGPGSVGNDLDLGVKKMKDYSKEVADLEAERQELINAQKLFDLPITSYPELLQIQKSMKGLESIYQIYEDQKKARQDWAQTLFKELNVQLLQDGIEGYLKVLRKLPREVKNSPVGKVLDERLKEFKESLPLFVDLKHEALRDRHWNLLMKKTGVSFEMNPETFTLENVFAMELHRFAETISEIVTAASKELAIEKGVKDVDDLWSSMKLNVIKYIKGNQDRGWILGAVDEVMQALDDGSMNLQSMASSRFIGPFLNTVQNWEKTLSLISEVLELWMQVTRKWMYLEGIFIGGDIRSQLPEEAKKFDQLDKMFKKIMAETSKDPNIRKACQAPNRLSDLETISAGLERCQKSLNDYLQSKRNAFPRFFFISDDELLSILGSADPSCVQEHMIKMYDNIQSLRFATGQNKEILVTAMISAENEVMEYKIPCTADGRVEDWMTRVEAEMRRTNRLITKEATFYYGYPGENRLDWMLKYQGGVCLSVSQVWWTWEVEDVFRKMKKANKAAMKDYAKKMTKQLDDLFLPNRVDKERSKETQHPNYC